ncbi:MAG: radical SAM protein [Deltaproteobacteria bacterium]|nr:radical SAM protein [Deltaproteobacteria bacterium]
MPGLKIALLSVVDRISTIPYGLVSIATYLEKMNPSHETRIFDRAVHNIKKEILKFNPDIIGIGSMTLFYETAKEVAGEIREYCSNTLPIIIGGVHITTLPQSFHRCFDIGVIGEGEITFYELVELYYLERSFHVDKLKKIRGLIFWDGPEIEATEKRPLVHPLDALPMPDYKYISKTYFEKRYWYGKFKVPGYIMTSRGCPYKCIFCSTRQFWCKVRVNSPEYVTRYIKQLIDIHEVHHITIMDDLFAANKKRVRRFIEEFSTQGIDKKISLSVSMRANLIDDDMCDLLKQLNVVEANFGFESGSDKILKMIKGDEVSTAMNYRAVDVCMSHGIKPSASFMFGVPGETLDDMSKTCEFIDRVRKKGAILWIFIATPFPATEFWQIAKKRGKVNDNMDFRLLDHMIAAEDALLLDEDIDRNRFKEILSRASLLIGSRKSEMIKEIILNDPLGAAMAMVQHPMRNLKKLYTLITKRYGSI